MQPKDKKLFEQELEELLKPMLKQLYIKWANYDSAIIHEAVTNYVFKRNHEKILKLCNSRKHRKLQYKALKSELDNIRVKKELEEFAKSL